MKKLGAFILIGLSLLLLSSCGKFNKEDNRDAMKSYCENYTSKYEIIEHGQDGAVMVNISAPNFTDIVSLILEENNNHDITVKDIERAVKEHPECKKEYIFWADEEKNDEIKKEFLEKVSEELMIEAIKNVEYTEEWSVEE